MIFSKISTVFIPVSNLKNAGKWYSEVLNFKIDDNQWSQIESLPVYTFQMEGTSLTLDANIVKKGELRPSSYPICNIACRNIDEEWERFQELGIEVLGSVTRFPDLCYFNFKDPDGNILMLCSE